MSRVDLARAQPLRAIYRRALDRGDVAVNPTLRLSLPAPSPGRERVARASEAAALIAALPVADRGLWATALYAGLRRGELQALDWADVDLDQRLIRVERSWDRRAGLIEPKSKSGKRRVPIPDVLRAHLLAHRLQQGRGGQGFVFAGKNGRPFDPGSVAAPMREGEIVREFDDLACEETRVEIVKLRELHEMAPARLALTSHPCGKSVLGDAEELGCLLRGAMVEEDESPKVLGKVCCGRVHDVYTNTTLVVRQADS